MQRKIPLATCLACGGSWFRESTYFEFMPEKLVGPIWPGWPVLVGQYSMAPMIIGVCRCAGDIHQTRNCLIL
jgi:hypothetical protein